MVGPSTIGGTLLRLEPLCRKKRATPIVTWRRSVERNANLTMTLTWRDVTVIAANMENACGCSILLGDLSEDKKG